MMSLMPALPPTELAVLRAVLGYERHGREVVYFHAVYCRTERDLGKPKSKREHRRRRKAVEQALSQLERGGQLAMETFYLKHTWKTTESGRELLAEIDAPPPMRPSVRARLSGLAERAMRRSAIGISGVL